MEKIEMLEILEDSFSGRWKTLGARENKEIYSIIRNEFLIDEIVNSVNQKLNNSKDPLTLRYQKYLLSYLSSEFAVILFFISNRGENINYNTVIESQKLLKTDSKCKIHPCTKLFG